MRLEDAGIMGAGQETLHQRCACVLMGRLGRVGRKAKQLNAYE